MEMEMRVSAVSISSHGSGRRPPELASTRRLFGGGGSTKSSTPRTAVVGALAAQAGAEVGGRARADPRIETPRRRAGASIVSGPQIKILAYSRFCCSVVRRRHFLDDFSGIGVAADKRVDQKLISLCVESYIAYGSIRTRSVEKMACVRSIII